MAEEKTNLLKVLWKYVVDYNWILFIIISTVVYLNQSNRQDYLERQVEKARSQALHQAETAYTVGISGLLQTATILETNLVEMKQQNLLLIDCVKKKNCEKFPELTILKPQKEYVPVATHYFKLREQMIEESKEDK